MQQRTRNPIARWTDVVAPNVDALAPVELVHRARRFRLVSLVTICGLCLSTRPTSAELGEVRSVLSPHSPAGKLYYCALGLAFDGDSLYVNRCGYSDIDVLSPLSGSLIRSIDSGVMEGPCGMAFDAKRGGLWIGTQAGRGRRPGRGCGTVGMPIYFLSLQGPEDDGSLTVPYTIPLNVINPTTQEPMLRQCNLTGLAYRENDPLRDDDDELWVADAQSRNVARFQLNDTCINGVLDERCLLGFDARDVDASLSDLNGLAVDAAYVYLASAGCGTCSGRGDVFRAVGGPGGFTASIPLVLGEQRWLSDMACDSTTFAPDTVLWVRMSPQGEADNNRITAYEIDPGPCDGAVVGACCDSPTGLCRNDVPAGACDGSWYAGMDCDEPGVPCARTHMLVLLDRSASMRTVRTDGRSRCSAAVDTAIYDIEQFESTNPPGSTVAVWTFHEAGPTPFTSGFVTAGDALSSLFSLNPDGCNDLTPLADSICDAADALVSVFPEAPPQTLMLAITTDGGENNSSGSCSGPASPSGESCGDFVIGSWQQRVCEHLGNRATVLVRHWNDFPTERPGVPTGESWDAERGSLLPQGVSDQAFFTALVAQSGGQCRAMRDTPFVQFGPSVFGEVGACCVSGVGCYADRSQAECAIFGGSHQGAGSTCASADCGVTVPTVSRIGGFFLALSVVTAGGLVLRRRTRFVH